MNSVINKFLLAGDKFMPEIHLRHRHLFRGRTSFFFVRQQEGRQIFLYSEIRVSKKGRMFLKYRNKQ